MVESRTQEKLQQQQITKSKLSVFITSLVAMSHFTYQQGVASLLHTLLSALSISSHQGPLEKTTTC